MNNYISMLLSILCHLNIITKAEGEKINEELQQRMLPDNFEAAYQNIKEVFEKAEIDVKDFGKKPPTPVKAAVKPEAKTDSSTKPSEPSTTK